jgi:hypothetical protein
MCTVSFIPTNSGYFFTSNRDEAIDRERALVPSKYEINGIPVYFPKDPHGGGTWFLTNGGTRTYCLLNGAFEKHEVNPFKNYVKSRGLVVLDILKYPSFESFFTNFSFLGLEPFTLIGIEELTNLIVQEIRWDGNTLHIRQLDEKQNHVWSSATLYDQTMRAYRDTKFHKEFDSKIVQSIEEISKFHHFVADQNSSENILIDRGNLKTISTLFLEKRTSKSILTYKDLLSGTVSIINIEESEV